MGIRKFPLTSIEIPSSVEHIEEAAFFMCTSLSSVKLSFGLKSLGNRVFDNCRTLQSIEIPSSITSIGEDAFMACIGLSSIELPSSIVNIGSSAFGLCYFEKKHFINNTSLSDARNWGVTIVDKRTEDGLIINNQTVIKCVENATSVNIPSDVLFIGENAFSGCLSLNNVQIPISVISIGSGAFCGCRSLSSITIPSNVSSIGSGAFQECNISSLEIPSSVSEIPNNFCYFCSNLESVIIHEGVNSIEDNAFAGCFKLKDLTIPSTISKFFCSALDACSSLEDVYCYANDMSLYYWGDVSDVFYGLKNHEVTLHVTEAGLSNYKNSKPWSYFSSIVADLESISPCDTPTIEIVEGKVVFHCLTPGAQFYYTLSLGPLSSIHISETGVVQMGNKCEITVWAIAEGYSPSAHSTSSVTLGMLGDSNADGYIDVSDITPIIDRILQVSEK